MTSERSPEGLRGVEGQRGQLGREKSASKNSGGVGRRAMARDNLAGL